jgi:hypothetical protein
LLCYKKFQLFIFLGEGGDNYILWSSFTQQKRVLLDGQRPPGDHEREPRNEDADVAAVLDHQHLVPGRVRIQVPDGLDVLGVQQLA